MTGKQDARIGTSAGPRRVKRMAEGAGGGRRFRDGIPALPCYDATVAAGASADAGRGADAGTGDSACSGEHPGQRWS